MESNVDDHDAVVVVPVPKPRRHNLNINANLNNNNKLAYENVSIDLINKNINIKEENIQNNAKNKLQTNKLFLMPNTSTSSASSSASNNINETSTLSSVNSVGSSSGGGGGSTQILTNLNDLANASSSKNQKNSSTIQLDEINKLSNIYNDDENVNVKPVPAPRRSNAPSSNVKHINCSASTGAISKKQSPSSFDINDFLESPKAKSKNNKNSGSYSFAADDECDATSSDDFVRKFSLKKRLSNSSLSSSQSGSSLADPSGSKYNSASPGQLLKAIGTHSKLLTESISERVSTRTKDAKQKIDRIQKSSRDRIAETTKQATKKINSVRKNIHSTIEMTQNLSLGRKKGHPTTSYKEEKSEKSGKNKSTVFHMDRTQSVPPNDQLFSSISFNSPLNSKTNKCVNINTADSSYEIPKSLRSISSDSNALNEMIDGGGSGGSGSKRSSSSNVDSNVPPPSYEDVIKEDKEACNDSPNPIARTRKKSKTNSNVYENHEINLTDKKTESSDSSETDANDRYSMPCPNFPAPVLNTDVASNESIYGKIRPKSDCEQIDGGACASTPIQPPVRLKRRKDSGTDESGAGAGNINSNRATIDSNEFHLEGKFKSLLSGDLSEDLSEKLKLEERKTSAPDRSDSWAYYDGNNSDDGSSSSEPIYENEREIRDRTVAPSSEPVYGILYNSENPTTHMLTPVAAARKRRSQERSIETQYAVVNKNPDVKIRNNLDTRDILKEFDPLDRRTLDKLLASKTNELKLLESILGNETYGNCENESNYEDHSTETSDGDDAEELPEPPERLDSLKECVNEDTEALIEKQKTKETKEQLAVNEPTEEVRRSVIIHQNSNLRSDSCENLADDLKDQSGASSSSNAMDESVIKETSNSRWFFGSALKSDSKTKVKNEKKCASAKQKEEKSYVEEIQSESNQEEKSLPPISKTSSMKSMFTNVMNRVEGIKRKTSFRNNANNKNDGKTQIVLEMIPRPCLTQRLTLHEGHLIRLPTGVVEDILKELHSRKAYIRDKKFQAYFDKDLKTPKENIPLETITTIQCVNNHKFTHNFVDIYCFEITTSISKNVGNNLSNPNMVVTSNNSGNMKAQRVCHLYGVAKESERFLWMQKLLESMTEAFPPGFACRFYRAGWCYSKNSITSNWAGSWVLLQKEKRRLLFYNVSNSNLECMDLRKARCIVLKESDDSIKNLHVESGPTLMIDCPPYTMYFIMTSPRETKIWRHIITEVAHNNGPALKEQQLTKDDVPVLVDKCINFIYAHGSMSEGIYRKSGSENSINKLLKQFRSDAYAVQIIRSDYTEHDVANVLKRFMRDLPDRLLGKTTTNLIAVSKMKDNREKIEAYKELLTRLPSIEYHTLRKLLGHLHFIQSQKLQNKMDYSNLAIVWGPTLLQEQSSDNVGYSHSSTTAEVVVDLIRFHKHLYALSTEEITKEQLMLAVLQKYHAAAENLSDTMKKSGDLKVWITIDANPDNESEEKQQVNVTLTPTKTVNDICKELASKINCESYAVTLSEVILNSTLERPLHHSEKVLDIVLKWSYWPESDRKDNFLRLTPLKNSFMKEIERALKVLPSVIPNKELKFADAQTKSLKSYTLELTGHKISVMKKEKNQITMVKDIDLMRTTAYLGCEKKRQFQLRWAITLIENNVANNRMDSKKERDTPFIGHIIAGTNSNDQVVWFSSILHSLYRDNIMPSPEIILP